MDVVQFMHAKCLLLGRVSTFLLPFLFTFLQDRDHNILHR